MFNIRKFEKILTISLIFLLVLPLISTNFAFVQGDSQKPSYAVGDVWKYKVEYFSASEIVMNGTITRRIIGELNVTVDDSEYECFIFEIAGDWKPPREDAASWTQSGKLYIEKTNLTLVIENTELKQIDEGVTIYHQITNITYHPPFIERDYPLAVGNTWWANTTKSETIELPPADPGTSILQITRNFSVTKSEVISVPAGSFDTLVIEHKSFDNIYEEYYSSTVGQNARELVYDRDRNLRMKIELIESSYIAPASPIDMILVLAIVVIIILVLFVIFYVRRKPTTGVTETTAIPTSTTNFWPS